MPKYVIVTGGGTGGHIFPAVNLLKLLKCVGIEAQLYTDVRFCRYSGDHVDYKFKVLPVVSPRAGMFKFFFKAVHSFFSILFVVRRSNVAAVVGFGSYASMPALFVSLLKGIPIVLHEQNALLSRVNRFFLPFSTAFFYSFPMNSSVDADLLYTHRDKCFRVGIPINNFEIFGCRADYVPPSDVVNISVFGGSSASRVFDEVCPKAFISVMERLNTRVSVVHQCSEGYENKLCNFYREVGIQAEVSRFFFDAPVKIRESHIVISRAGAMSMAEITHFSRPAIYVPYPGAINDHQFANAEYVSKIGGCLVVRQTEFTTEFLISILVKWLCDTNLLCSVANNCASIELFDRGCSMLEFVADKVGVCGLGS